MGFSGSSSITDLTILIFTTWDAVWDHLPAVLWDTRKLDCLLDQCFVHWVQNKERKREGWLQKPCHSGTQNLQQNNLKTHWNLMRFLSDFWNGFVFKIWNLKWFEVLDGLLGKHWRNVGLAFNCTFLLFGSVIQLIACARYLSSFYLSIYLSSYSLNLVLIFPYILTYVTLSSSCFKHLNNVCHTHMVLIWWCLMSEQNMFLNVLIVCICAAIYIT